MKWCPITYELIKEEQSYSEKGLKLLAPTLKNLKPLPFGAAELRKEAAARAGKMSVQGVQTKLSAQLKIKDETFELVDQFGHYILKPQSEYYQDLPENEAITMTLAGSIGLDIPIHGLLYSQDGSMTYFIKRFDRIGKTKRLPVEDFAQLIGLTRDTKYNASMEQTIKVIMEFCSFPAIELVKFFKLTLFNFLVGNEDMHLKNISLITKNDIVMLSPGYDLVNSSIALRNAKEEIALPLNGKKKNLTSKDFFQYLAVERTHLSEKTVHSIIQLFKRSIPIWIDLINISFLSARMKEEYLRLLFERSNRLLS
jgi:serine/threonine-protein kinase HipA